MNLEKLIVQMVAQSNAGNKQGSENYLFNFLLTAGDRKISKAFFEMDTIQ
jgi:hypothetical protein